MNAKLQLQVLSATGLFLFFSLILSPPSASEDLDSKIKVIEEKIQLLKRQQEEVQQTYEDVTAAASSVPNFSYRPGSGVLIEAQDKSWSLRFSADVHFELPFHSGKDQVGRSNGEVHARRFRPYFFYCIENCLYEIIFSTIHDGWGRGNAKNATGTGVGAILQEGSARIHLEQISPWLPAFYFGMGVGNTLSQYRRGPSATGAQFEYDLLSRNNNWNVGNPGVGTNLAWENLSLRTLGIPGIATFEVGMGGISEGDDSLQTFTDKKDFNLYGRLEPFAETKDKWLGGLGFEAGAWFCNPDRTINDPNASFHVFNACGRNRVRDNGPGGRQVLFAFTPPANASVNGGPKGDAQYYVFGAQWRVGPYWFRAIRGIQNFNFINRQAIDAKARNFLVAHEIFVWSPKGGFFTGSPLVPGSILFGFHYERNDYSCGHSRPNPPCADGGQFSRNRILLREWDLWVFLTNRMSVGLGLFWYDASNLRTGKNQAGETLGVFPDNCPVSQCRGRGGDWLDFILRARLNF